MGVVSGVTIAGRAALPSMRVSVAIAVVVVVVGALGACSSKVEDEPTFSKTIAPLVQEKCQGCHREGGIAPFPLVTYADLRRVGALAKEKVTARTMPPWGAADDVDCKM